MLDFYILFRKNALALEGGKMPENFDIMIELIRTKKYAKLREMLDEVNPADVALIFDELEKKEWLIAFRVLPKELAADTFAYLDTDMQRTLIEAFSDKEITAVMEELFMDDTVDMLEEMPAHIVAKILKNVNAETRAMINELLHYPKDSAGSIMTTEYVSLKAGMTVEEAFAHIRKVGVDKETIYNCYVTDNRKLMGLVSVKDLLLANYEDKVEDIMSTNVISVETHEDQEIVGNMFNKYGFIALPVVDGENRLVGIVTFDDAIEVIVEENEEDIEAMAAILPSDKPYMKEGVFDTWKKRVPWLLALMLSSTFTSKIISGFEEALSGLVVLNMFIPMIMGTGGNAGNQASVTIIRGLSMEEIEYGDIWRIIWKEVRVALLCGLIVGGASVLKIITLDGQALDVAIVVSVALAVTIVLAKFIGCSLPIIVKRMGFDPAVMVSPFVTTIVDAVSLIIYFAIAVQVFNL